MGHRNSPLSRLDHLGLITAMARFALTFTLALALAALAVFAAPTEDIIPELDFAAGGITTTTSSPLAQVQISAQSNRGSVCAKQGEMCKCGVGGIVTYGGELLDWQQEKCKSAVAGKVNENIEWPAYCGFKRWSCPVSRDKHGRL